MRIALVLVAAATLVACSRDKTYESGGTTDTTADTTRRGLPDIDVRMKTDTVTIPTIGTVKDTIIVTKPVKTGEKKVEIQRPTVDVKRP